MSRIVAVVLCFNEAGRLERPQIVAVMGSRIRMLGAEDRSPRPAGQ